MKRILIAITLVAALSGSAAVSLAGEPGQAASGAPPAAQNADKSVEAPGGCMPGGGCCGDPACTQAAAGDKKTAMGKAAGGCPCSKRHKAQKKK